MASTACVSPKTYFYLQFMSASGASFSEVCQSLGIKSTSLSVLQSRVKKWAQQRGLPFNPLNKSISCRVPPMYYNIGTMLLLYNEIPCKLVSTRVNSDNDRMYLVRVTSKKGRKYGYKVGQVVEMPVDLLYKR